MIPDDELRARLAIRADAARPGNVARIARGATAARRPTSGPSPRMVGGVSVAATVVIAAALGGSLLLRGAPVASPSLAGLPSGTGPQPSATVPAVAPDPTPWTAITWDVGDLAPFDQPGSIVVSSGVWDGSRYLVVGYGDTGGKVWRSPDGDSWDPLDGDGLADAVITSMFRVGNEYVVVGYRRQRVTGDPVPDVQYSTVWRSNDGVAWHERSPERGTGDLMGRAAGGPAGMVMAIRDTGGRAIEGLMVADPELNWTRVDVPWPDNVRIWGFAPGVDGWIAYGETRLESNGEHGSTGAIWTSLDGRSWSPADVEEPGGMVDGIVPVGGGFLAFGYEIGRCEGCMGGGFTPRVNVPTWFSADGRAWTRETMLNTGPELMVLRIVSDGDRAIAIGSGEDSRLALKESLDGATWHDIEGNHAGATGALLDDLLQFWLDGPVIVGPDRLVAVHNGVVRNDPHPVPAVGIPKLRAPDAATIPPSGF